MPELILIGGGGHCRSCIDVIELQGKYKIIGILDISDKVGETLLGYPILDSDEAIGKYVDLGCHFLITVGQIESSSLRQKLYEKLVALNASIATVVSPRAYVARTAKIGQGVIVMHDALINAGALVSENCIINTKSLIEHDAIIAAHCHISTCSVVNGGANISKGTFVGSNAVVIHGSHTEKNDFIKAGSIYFSSRKPKVSVKTAVLTTIYPVNEAYVQDYFNSLINQTVRGFDVILVNDGFGNINLLRAQYPQLNIIELEAAGNIAKNRECMCQFALRNQYDIAVFADIDDYFSDNRIAHSIDLLKEYDVVVNDLTAFSEIEELATYIFSSRIRDKELITLDFIRDKNLFGLSNTAVRLSTIEPKMMFFPNTLVAVDWYLFSTLLYKSKRAVFTNKAVTYYRQHPDNMVGIGSVTKEKLLDLLRVRDIHYHHMLAITETYQIELEKNFQLTAQLQDKGECEAILRMNQTTNDSLFWWEVITK